MSAAKQTPGPWLITTIVRNKATRYAVARAVGHNFEFVCSASGRVSAFKTREAAQRALRIAKATGSAA